MEQETSQKALLTKKGAVRLVVSDIDGTLIRGGEGFPGEVKKAVEQLKKLGIQFTFASGRLPYMIVPYLEELGLSHMPVCACNGTLLWQDGKALESHPLRMARLFPLIREALLRDMTVLYGINGTEYCMQENETVRRKRRERGYYHPIRPMEKEDWETLFADKINILDEKGRTGELLFWEKELSDICHITHYGNLGLEIVAAGYGKEYGLERLSHYLRIPISEILAIGDNENDDAMLKLAGIGGAVGNAILSTKACADIVAEQEAGRGVAELIEKICFGKI